MNHHDPFAACRTIESTDGTATIFSLRALADAGLGDIARLPITIKVLLESALRNLDGFSVTEDHVRAIADWNPAAASQSEIPFKPARVILQDFTGVPSVVDLAALRSAMSRAGGDPELINPEVAVDLVIDHSVQVDAFGSIGALMINSDREFERNRERYEFLHWGQQAFENFRVVPPASGIVHQVNLEHLASVVVRSEVSGEPHAWPDSLVGTDSHTTMINGLGVLGWGVGGIEAEAVMLGQPIYMLLPDVVGFELTGELEDGVTATDLVLRVTEMLRSHGVVGKLVEFFGDGIGRLSLPDRATIANMAPEYGATCGFFPVDAETLDYLRRTDRAAGLDLVERYCKEQGMFRRDGEPAPRFSEKLALDMATVVPSLAGPKRPQDRISLSESKRSFFLSARDAFAVAPQPSPAVDNSYVKALDAGEMPNDVVTTRRDLFKGGRVDVDLGGQEIRIGHGSVVIAAITSCTNTSNPSVMIGAGLLARKAVEAGLDRKPWVKTSMAPGSKVVTRYLDASGLEPYLQALGFHTVGYGCTSCIGNSGPLPAPIEAAIKEHDLVVASVLSGNRNFEGRVHPLTRANYLASPPLVVAYAIAGTMDIDFATEPLGSDPTGKPVYLADVWPSQSEISAAVAASLDPEMFRAEYNQIFTGNPRWNDIGSGHGVIFDWPGDSTYIREPTFFKGMTPEAPAVNPIRGARVLALLGDSITTDHISPAGAIPSSSPAGQYLLDHGVEIRDFNSYGSRRGNHEVMVRGTFANIRLRNHLAPGTEGGVTRYLPDGEEMTIFEAAERYAGEGVPLIVLAGKEYGTGSSRDWAAKGTLLLGVKAVIAESYERIHRSNLIGMGVLPLQFEQGESWSSLGISGEETFDIALDGELRPGQRVPVSAERPDGSRIEFSATLRADSPIDVRYYKNGGILHTVLRDLLRSEAQPAG